MQAELAKAQAKHRKQGRPPKENHAYGMELKQGSNQSTYLLRRLARDHPVGLRHRSATTLAPSAGAVGEAQCVAHCVMILRRFSKRSPRA
jgi:hypothetical protein